MRSPLLSALFNPLNLATLVLALVSGLCAAWWLFPVGLVVWVIMFILAYRDPALQLNHVIQLRTPLPQRFQKPFDRIQRAQVSLFNHLSSTKPQVRRSFQPLRESVNQLIDQSYHLCLRMATLQNYYLVTKAARDFEGEMFIQKVKVENAKDEITKREHLTNLKNIEEQADSFRQIAILLERVETQLTGVSSTLDNVLVDALRLQALRSDEIDKELPALIQLLQTQSEQLSMFEKEAASSKI